MQQIFTDQQIINGILKMDNALISFICSDLWKICEPIGLRYVKTDVNAQDMFQNTWIMVIEEVRSGGFIVRKNGSFYGFLIDIYKKTCFNYFRNVIKKNLNIDDDTKIPPFPGELIDKLIIKDDRKIIAFCLNNMSSLCKKILLLYFTEEKIIWRNVAINFNMTYTAIRVRATECRNEFYLCLRNNGYSYVPHR